MRSPPRTSLDITNGTQIKTVIPRDPRKTLTQEDAARILEAANLKGFRALGHRLIVLVNSPPERTAGGLWYPTTTSGGSALFDDRLGSKVFIVGDILAAGPEAHTRACRKQPFSIGERVYFSRMNFGWLSRIEQEDGRRGDYVGFVDPIFLEATVTFDDE